MNSLTQAKLIHYATNFGWSNHRLLSDGDMVFSSAYLVGRLVLHEYGDAILIAFEDSNTFLHVAEMMPQCPEVKPGWLCSKEESLSEIFHLSADLSVRKQEVTSTSEHPLNIDEPDPDLERRTETVRDRTERLGQSEYRKRLMEMWDGRCAVSGIAVTELLRASHAKPWAACTSYQERLDPYNGFLLEARYDALFDTGLITFTADGRIIVSSRISPSQLVLFHLSTDTTVKLKPQHIPYLAWHLNKVYKM